METRAARLEDYAGIAALQERNGLAARPYSDWSAFWTANPALAHFPSTTPQGWVIEDRDGEIRGYLGNVPLTYTYRGRVIRAATPVSWVVDKAYRFHSLDLQHRFVSQKDVDLFVYTTLNATTETVLRAFSFVPLTVGEWDTAGLWITKHLGFAQSVARAKAWPSWTAAPVAAGLAASDQLRDQPASGTEFELVHNFDARFDTFWDELTTECRAGLLAVRDHETLDWHFRRARLRNDLWIFTASRAGRMVAYALFDRYDNPELKLKRMRIADFQALAGYEHLLRDALGAGLEKARREGIHAVENTGCWLDRYQIRGTRAPHRRRLQNWLFYYKARDPQFQRELQNTNTWLPSSFDGDASI